MRSPPSPAPRSRVLTRRTVTGPISVWTARSGPSPCRTIRSRPSGSRLSFIAARNAFRLRPNGMGQQPAGAVPQDGGQRILRCHRLREWDNGAIARHGVSPLREVQAGSPPASIRRLPHVEVTKFWSKPRQFVPISF
jgi:hypothetical protein